MKLKKYIYILPSHNPKFSKNCAGTWPLNRGQADTLLAAEVDFWRRCAKGSREANFRNDTIVSVEYIWNNWRREAMGFSTHK